MTDFSSLLTKVNDLKAKVEQNSISPVYMGALLDDIIKQLQAIDMTDKAEDIQTALSRASAALSSAQSAITRIGSVEASVGEPGGIAPLTEEGVVQWDFLDPDALAVREFAAFVSGITVQTEPTIQSSTTTGCLVVYNTDTKRFLLAMPKNDTDGSGNPFIPWIFDHDTGERRLRVSGFYFYAEWSDADYFGRGERTDGRVPDNSKLYICTSKDSLYRWDGTALALAAYTTKAGQALETKYTALNNHVVAIDSGRELFINLNRMTDNANPMESLAAALDAVPEEYRLPGVIVRFFVTAPELDADGNAVNRWEAWEWDATPFDDWEWADMTHWHRCDAEYLREQAKMAHFIDKWNAAFKVDGTVYGKYDPDNAPDPQHPFYGNELWMTYEEALAVDRYSTIAVLNANNQATNFGASLQRCRTLYPMPTSPRASLYGLTSGSLIETVRIIPYYSTGFDCIDLRMAFAGNSLRKVFGAFYFPQVNSPNYTIYDWIGPSLEEFRGAKLKCSMSVRISPKLSLPTFQFMVENANNGTTPITITVHPDVYAKLTGDTTNAAAAATPIKLLREWQALVTAAAEKNITFATV